MNFYETLQVTPDAEPEVIEAAYRRLAFKYHPDKNSDPAAGRKMRDLNEAYETLRDPQRRKQYDIEQNSDETLRQVCLYADAQLSQGKSPSEVINALVKMGMDLKTSEVLVSRIVEIRNASARNSRTPYSSTIPSPGWWKSAWLYFKSWSSNQGSHTTSSASSKSIRQPTNCNSETLKSCVSFSAWRVRLP